jgi:hypothetical protein
VFIFMNGIRCIGKFSVGAGIKTLSGIRALAVQHSRFRRDVMALEADALAVAHHFLRGADSSASIRTAFVHSDVRPAEPGMFTANARDAGMGKFDMDVTVAAPECHRASCLLHDP